MFEINRNLFSLKLILFFWFGAAACLLPYMTIHMKQLGITVEETAFVYTVLPVTQIIGPPIAGFVSDKFGNYKLVLIINLVLTILSSAGIMFVPSSGDPNSTKSVGEVVYSSHSFTFWLYFCIRIVFQITVGICFTLLDATTLVLSEKYKSSFGKERFWAIFATGLFSPICGVLIDYLSDGKDEYSTDYSPSFHFFNILVFFTTLTLIMMNIEVAPPQKNMLQNVKPLLKSINIWALLIVIFILGTCWGFVESFLFWYLLELNSPKYLLGLTLTTGAVVGLPFLIKSEWFVQKAGHVNLMILALVFYLIRFGGYSLIQSPFWCIPFEAMEAFTYHLMWCAAATYSQKLAPEGLTATMLGIVGGLHYGVGRAAGSMFGGSLMAIFNARIAFRIVGIFAGVVALVYAIIYYTFLKKDEIKLINEKKEFTKDIENIKSEDNIGLKDVQNLKSTETMETTNEENVSIHQKEENEKEETNEMSMNASERCGSICSQTSVISANLSLSHPI